MLFVGYALRHGVHFMKHRAKRKKHKPKGHHRKSSGKHHRKPPPYHSRTPPLSFVQIQQSLHKRVKLFFRKLQWACDIRCYNEFGYAPKYFIEYLKNINTGEKQKASHSKNDLLNGGGEGSCTAEIPTFDTNLPSDLNQLDIFYVFIISQ